MNLRLQKLRKLLKEQNTDAILISSLPSIIHLTGFSEFSTEDRDAFLLITQKEQYIFTHGIYREVVQKKVAGFTLIPILRENPIGKAVQEIIEKQNIDSMEFEAFDVKVSEYEQLIKHINKKKLTHSKSIATLRVTKTPDEVKAIRNACKIGDQTYNHILTCLKPGITEKELAVELEHVIKKKGADISFPPVIAFGPNASQPHHVPDKTKLKKNSLILFDFGVKHKNYCSDMTRTVFFGKATKAQKEVYETVLSAQQKAIDYLKSALSNPQSSINAIEVDKISRDYIISKGFPSMPHSLGHGIGLEVHESPRLTPVSKDILKQGMVFSIEPGIYLPDEFGVRIEDLFAIENGKLVQLTKSPRKFTEV